MKDGKLKNGDYGDQACFAVEKREGVVRLKNSVKEKAPKSKPETHRTEYFGRI